MVVSRTYSGVYLLIGLHAVLVYVLPQIVTEEWAFLRRIWGFHFWEFYPVWAVVCAYSVAVLMAIPGIQRRAYDVLSVWIPKGMFSYKHLFFFCLSVASWGVFWIFRQKYGFLGDGYLRAADLDRQSYPPDTSQ